MKLASFILITLLSFNFANAADAPLWCSHLIQGFQQLKKTTTTPVAIQSAVDEASARALEITQQAGINAFGTSVEVTEPTIDSYGNQIYGAYIEATDEGGWVQGNGMTFWFSIKPQPFGEYAAFLLESNEWWHIGSGVYNPACEN